MNKLLTIFECTVLCQGGDKDCYLNNGYSNDNQTRYASAW